MRNPVWLLRAAFSMVLVWDRVCAGEPTIAAPTVTVGFVTAGERISGGSGPVLSIEAPPTPLGWGQEMVPKITVAGPPGTPTRVEWASEPSGPWTAWSNVVLNAEGVVLVDLRPQSERRFYRASSDPRPAGFVWIPPGTFVMGSPELENQPNNEVPHTVTLTRGFWLSDHEVTQGEFESVMRTNPSKLQGDLDRPVETVSWEDAVVYCQRLTMRERAAGRITDHQSYRLPTEAEWEYAARAGTTGARYGELDAIAWYSGNSGGESHRVKQKLPNEWGLHDMLGNVWEWCSDVYNWYPSESVTDPTGPRSGLYHIFRGGSYNFPAEYQRSACRRFGINPGLGSHYVGFRTAFSSVR